MSKSLINEVYSRLADVVNRLDELKDDVKEMLPEELPPASKDFLLEKFRAASKMLDEGLTSLQRDEEEYQMTKAEWNEVKGDLEYHERKEMGEL